MGIRGDQADAPKAAGEKRAQEREPGRPLLGGDDVEPERLAVAIAAHGHRVHDPGAHGAAAFAAPRLERVEHQVGVGPLRKRPGAELLDELVEQRARRETRLFDIRSTPSRPTSFSTRRVETPAK